MLVCLDALDPQRNRVTDTRLTHAAAVDRLREPRRPHQFREHVAQENGRLVNPTDENRVVVMRPNLISPEFNTHVHSLLVWPDNDRVQLRTEARHERSCVGCSVLLCGCW